MTIALPEGPRPIEHTELIRSSEIAETVGYGDARVQMAFKRWSGELPAAYRHACAALPNGEGNL